MSMQSTAFFCIDKIEKKHCLPAIWLFQGKQGSGNITQGNNKPDGQTSGVPMTAKTLSKQACEHQYENYV